MAYDPRVLDSFQVAVNNGEVEGYSNKFIIGYNPNLTTAFSTVWSGGSDMTDHAVDEVYEVVSTSANDTAAGTGAQSVLVISLDEDGNKQQNIVELNGTTAVAVPGTHSFPDSFLVISSGSGQANEGELTLRVSGTGATRNHILAGEANALSAVYKVPNGKKFHLMGLDYHTGGADKKVRIKTQTMLPDSNTWLTTSILPSIHQSFTTSFQVSAAFEPGTIIRYTASVSSGSGDDVAVIASGYEVDI